MNPPTRTALIFGGSRGIGAAIVARLARDGCRVAFTYSSSPADADALVASIEESGGEALAIRANSEDPSQIRAAVRETVGCFGIIDIVVVNAGILRLGEIEDVDLATLDQMLAINVRGVYLSIQATVSNLADEGRVIVIGSNAALHTGVAGSSVYQMTKGALVPMVKGIALDLAPRRITVNNVQPGPTETNMTADSLELLAGRIPLRRVAQPEEIAGLVSYIASAEAGYMTGASVTIDGGYTL